LNAGGAQKKVGSQQDVLLDDFGSALRKLRRLPASPRRDAYLEVLRKFRDEIPDFTVSSPRRAQLIEDIAHQFIGPHRPITELLKKTQLTFRVAVLAFDGHCRILSNVIYRDGLNWSLYNYHSQMINNIREGLEETKFHDTTIAGILKLFDSYAEDVYGIHVPSLKKHLSIIIKMLEIPAGDREAFEKLVFGFVENSRRTTERAKTEPRPHWRTARQEDETLPQFIMREFAPELADGTMTKAKLNRYGGLYQGFFNWLRHNELPSELQNIPTKKQLNDRQVAEGVSLPARSDEVRRYERNTKRVAAASRRTP